MIKKLKIGLIQAKVSDNFDETLARTTHLVTEASKKGARIICLQELFTSKYFCQTENREFFKTAEKIPGRITGFLSQLAQKNSITLVGGSIFEIDGDNYYNTTLIFDENGQIISKYRKIHIPHDPHYFEQFYFSSGNLGYQQVLTQNVKIAPLICFDQWFPEAARINTLKGTQLIFYPTAIGFTPEMQQYEPFSAKRWENAMASHASMNGIYVAAVNRVGQEDEIDFWGGSFIADPNGEIIAKASSKDEEVLVAELDLDKIEESQQGWGFLRNRQPESYSELISHQ